MKMRAIRKEMEQKASGRGLNGNVSIGSCIGYLAIVHGAVWGRLVDVVLLEEICRWD